MDHEYYQYENKDNSTEPYALEDIWSTILSKRGKFSGKSYIVSHLLP